MTTSHTFTPARGPKVEVPLTAARCDFGRCTHTMCVAGFELDSQGNRRAPVTPQNYELVPLVISEIEDMVKSHASGRFAAADARDLMDKGQHVLAAGRLVHALEHARGIGHPVTRWLGSVVASTDHPNRRAFARRYSKGS